MWPISAWQSGILHIIKYDNCTWESSSRTKELFNPLSLILKARHLHGSTFYYFHRLKVPEQSQGGIPLALGCGIDVLLNFRVHTTCVTTSTLRPSFTYMWLSCDYHMTIVSFCIHILALQASLDEPTQMIVMHHAKPNKLQCQALLIADKVGSSVSAVYINEVQIIEIAMYL